jgi:hypothetical protein
MEKRGLRQNDSASSANGQQMGSNSLKFWLNVFFFP